MFLHDTPLALRHHSVASCDVLQCATTAKPDMTEKDIF